MTGTLDPLRNPLDPLHKTPKDGRELFKQLYAAIDGQDRKVVLDAMANLLVNVLREVDDSQKKANDHVDQFAAMTKRLLDQHYDGLGRRRNIFPHHQIIEVPFLGRLDDLTGKS